MCLTSSISQIDEFAPANRWYVGFIHSTFPPLGAQMNMVGRGAI